MKTSSMITTMLVTLVLMASFSTSQAQDNAVCKVLLKEIAGSYSGDCSNGLAQGKGTARGRDVYSGSFDQGLPDGKGVYTDSAGNSYKGYWKNGLKHGRGKLTSKTDGKKTTLTGYWANGTYAGEFDPEEEYRITNRIGIDDVTIRKVDDLEDAVDLVFIRADKKAIPRDLSIDISSGNQAPQSLKVVLMNYNRPFRSMVRFTVPVGNMRKDCSLGFMILQPGHYEVVIINR